MVSRVTAMDTLIGEDFRGIVINLDRKDLPRCVDLPVKKYRYDELRGTSSEVNSRRGFSDPPPFRSIILLDPLRNSTIVDVTLTAYSATRFRSKSLIVYS